MINPTTVSASFIKWMETNGYGTFGTTIFLNQIPDEAPNNAWLVVTAGGSVRSNLVTAQNIKQYSLDVTCRNVSGEAVKMNYSNLKNALTLAVHSLSTVLKSILSNLACLTTVIGTQRTDAKHR